MDIPSSQRKHNSTTETNEALLRPTSSSTSLEQRARFHEQAASEVSHERPSSIKKTTEKKHPVGIYLFLIGALFAGITLGTAKNDNNEFDFNAKTNMINNYREKLDTTFFRSGETPRP